MQKNRYVLHSAKSEWDEELETKPVGVPCVYSTPLEIPPLTGDSVLGSTEKVFTFNDVLGIPGIRPPEPVSQNSGASAD